MLNFCCCQVCTDPREALMKAILAFIQVRVGDFASRHSSCCSQDNLPLVDAQTNFLNSCVKMNDFRMCEKNSLV